METVKQKCCVFIDNSNLFIEGQKFFARHKNLRASVVQDIRFRIDIGQMLGSLLSGREKISAVLYGSEPPPNDSLWKEIRSRGIEVQKFKRNSEDREKELDTSLAADATEQACDLREPNGSVTFIVVAGDRDYLPCYKKVLKRGWKLEIAAWKNCLSHNVEIFVQDNQDRGVSLILLDDLAARNPHVYFLSDKWDTDEELPIDRTIVFEYEKPVEQKEAKQLNSDVTDLIKFPCWYLHVHNQVKDSHIVMIIIIPKQNEGKYSTNNLYEGIKVKFATRCKRIVDFFTFKQNKDFEEKKEGEYKDHDRHEEAGVGEDESEGGEYEVVGAKRRIRKQKFSDYCTKKFACHRGKNCPYAHTAEEKEHFKNHPQKLGKLFKAKVCTQAQNDKCRYQRYPKQCCYAHNVSEARCYNCDPGGLEGKHWMDECPNKKF